MLLIWMVVLALPFASEGQSGKAQPDDEKEKVYKGTLQHPVYAIGGETTGTVLKTESGEFELDLGGQPMLQERVRSLANKPVVVSGRLSIGGGVEVEKRRIIKVNELNPADGTQAKDQTKKAKPKEVLKGQPLPVSLTGTLRHPVTNKMGQHDGTVLEAEEELFELDLGGQPMLQERMRSLANKPVVVSGRLSILVTTDGSGTERRVVEVTELKSTEQN